MSTISCANVCICAWERDAENETLRMLTKVVTSQGWSVLNKLVCVWLFKKDQSPQVFRINWNLAAGGGVLEYWKTKFQKVRFEIQLIFGQMKKNEHEILSDFSAFIIFQANEGGQNDFLNRFHVISTQQFSKHVFSTLVLLFQESGVKWRFADSNQFTLFSFFLEPISIIYVCVLLCLPCGPL